MSGFGKEYFDGDGIESQSGEFDLIPEGWYVAEIKKAEIKPTKDGTGTRLNLRHDIEGPTHSGRVVFEGINITNQSQKAEEIGNQQMTSIRLALGIARLRDPDQLIGGRLMIKVATQPAQNGYEPKNTVKAWKAIDGSKIPAPVAGQQTASSASASKAPWAK
jgi:hypothetical protein